MDWIYLAGTAATLYLCGLIWVIQIVHYPSFTHVDVNRFAQFETFHTRRITWVVAPPMLVELAAAVAMVLWRPDWLPATLAWLGLGLVAVIWCSTMFLQVPQHRRLAEGFDKTAWEQLVRTNWIRTVAWTARAGLMIVPLGLENRSNGI